MLIPAEFFARHAAEVAPELLGAIVLSNAGGVVTGGIIVECEAYLGSDDPGSHAATRGITKRNATMYGPPGRAYVYFTYGNHHMLNFVCEPEGVAGGVLIRALEPTTGIEMMTRRRHGRPLRELCSGPGKLTEALGLDLSDNGTTLGSGRIAVHFGERPASDTIQTSGRIGLTAGYDLGLRWFIADNAFVSPARVGRIRTGVRRSKKGESE